MENLIQQTLAVLVPLAVSTALMPPAAQAAAFTPGNIVVYRAGSGTGSEVNTGNPVFLDEYTTSGTLVQSIALPTAKSGAQYPLIASGTASSEGALTRSVDGRYIICTGYGTTTGGSSLPGTSSATVPRVIGRVDANGNVDTSTALTDWTSGNNPRCAASADGTAFWGAGAAGDNYATFGSTTSTALTNQNTRVINLYSNQLYISTSTSGKILDTLGSGEPTSGTQTITALSGITNSSPYAFVFFTLNGGAGPDTVYVADDGIGIVKYCLVSGSWVNKGAITASSVRGLCGSLSGSTITLYGTTGGTGASGGGTIYKVTDTAGYNAAPSSASAISIATAAANTAFRGIAFAPVGYLVTYNGNDNTGGSVPTDDTLYAAGATVTVAGNAGDLTETGYTFAGWNTAADGSGTSYSAGDTFVINANTTLYAQWTINNYAVSYDGNGNTGGDAPAGGTYNYNTTITVSNQNTLVKSGSTFTGWNTAADGSGASYAAGSSLTVVSNTTLYAQWANTPTIIISGGPLNFGAVAAGGASASQSYTVSGANLTAGIVIGSSSSNFKVSIDNNSFSSSVTLTPSGGSVNNASIYVQFYPDSEAGFSGTITNASIDAPEQDVAVSGFGANVPSVSTQSASGISTNGATLNGTVTSSNNAAITDRGFYYKSSPGVATSDTKVDEGGMTQSAFSASVAGLNPNQAYYYRAYAVNTIGTTLDSSDTSFYTLANTPAAPTIGSPTQTSLNLTIGAGDGNPAETTYAIQEVASGNYVQGDGTLGASAVYQTSSAWGTITVSGLTHGVFYKFQVKAQNGAGIDSGFGPTAGASTMPLAFTPANLIVERVGDGTETLSAEGNTIYLDEFTTAGAAVQSIQIPDSGALALVESGTSGSDGSITRSSDGLALCFPGYNTSLPYGSSITSAAGTAVPRGVGLINSGGIYSLAALSATADSGNNIRGAATDNDGNYWCSGAASGLSYLGSGTPATVYSTVSNLRCVNLFGTNLWFSTGSGSTTRGIWEFTGAPTTGATPTQIIQLGANDSAYNFAVDNATNPTTIYYADDGSQGTGNPGVHKWVNGAGGWTQAYVLYSASGVYGLAVDWTTTPVTVYATTTNSANNLLQIVDNGANSSAKVLATAPGGEFYRGIAFTPKGSQTITFDPLADSTFGDADFALTASASSGLTVTYASSDPTVATVSGNTVHILKAGSTIITASQAGNDYYQAAASVPQTLTVDKATPSATLTVNNSPVTYDGNAHAATVIISSSSTSGSVQNIQTGGATGQTNVEAYPVTADFVPDDTADYNSLTGLSAGDFAINPAALSITANSTNKLFGVTLVFAGTEFTTAGLLGNDSVGSVTLSSAGAAANAPAGSYPIVPSAAVGSGLGNYNITYNNGTLTVTGSPASQFTGIVANPDGSVTLTFTGGSGLTYRIQATADLADPAWADIATVTVDGSGSATVVDTNSMVNAKFYRAVYP